MKFLAAFAEHILNRIAPLPENNRAHWLAVAEQSRETWEKGELDNLDCPKCFPDGWELEVHDAVYEDDELWAAAQRKDSAPIPPGAAPADADSPLSASAGIPTVARVITQTLRTLQGPNAVVIKDALERELAHHFEFRSK